MKERTLAVVSAGLSQPSSTRLLADRLTAATTDELTKVDIRAEVQRRRGAQPRPRRDEPPADRVRRRPGCRRSSTRCAGADGLIAVTPIFNASYSGLFKSFFDVFDTTALADKPVLIAATGGTARHSLALEHALRPLFVYLRRGRRTDLGLRRLRGLGRRPRLAGGRADPDRRRAGPRGRVGVGGEGALHDRIRRAARELAGQMSLREPATVADPFELTTTFDDLLA